MNGSGGSSAGGNSLASIGLQGYSTMLQAQGVAVRQRGIDVPNGED